MNSKNKVTRYHEEEDQKFSNLKPGVISEKLRNALGLRKNEYPSYIYGMRELGYPPGWMEDAKFVGSSLSMFNINGGKVKRDKGVKKKGLDPTKIIAYPGFNAPMQKGFSDDYRKYRVRPYSKIMDRNLMLKRFEDFPEAESNSDNSDMDLDDTMETESRTMGIQKVMKMETSSYNSPTLTELEKEKRKLIDALNASNTSSQINISLNESNNNGENDEAKYVNTTESIPLVAVKSSVLGTPILKSSSPYSRLPKPDNFTVGVSPVIDFENLPNSTGTYEQMSEVLSKVRNTLKNLESCKS
ncbi:hypothetical protein HHI36_007934 [Cryptolaemus montrouzieri]|uniref:PSP proline-rich domain-containing protein n=1 Tax=Cryptolaemus montrouzieri TaxID=559131 RepID=A0ABD2MR66_9CUCU